MPFTNQLTAVFELPLTVAVNCWVPKLETVGATGETLTVTFEADGVTVIDADPDFVVSATEVAVTVTKAGFGTVAGAV